MSDVFTWDPAASATPPTEGAAPATAGVFTWDPVSQRGPSLWDKLKTAYTKTQEITAPVKAQSAEGLQQLGQESKAVVNMFAGVPGGVASVGMDALSRISSLMYGDSPKVAGQKARAVADQVNQDWGKITSALGITQDAKGSKIDALMQWGMEASDKGGTKLEKATKGVLSLETTQSVRDTLLNLLGARGLMMKPKAGVAPTADALVKKPDLEQAAVHETKIQEAAKVSPEAEATVVQDIVTDALARRTALEKYWAGQKGRTKVPDPWERTVAALVEETPKVEELKPQEGPGVTPKTKLEEGTVIGEAPDLIQSGLDKLRAGELISKEEATAIRRLTPRPGEGTIVDSTGKPFFQRGAVDPDLLVKTLGIMGLGAVAAKVLTDWYSSGGLSGDNSGDVGMALAGAGAAGVVKGKGIGMWHPETVKKLATRLEQALFKSEADRDAARIVQAYGKPLPETVWATTAVTNYLNRHAGTVTDPIKDLRLPDGTKWEDLTDKALMGTTKEQLAGSYAGSAIENAKPGETIWKLRSKVFGTPEGAAVSQVTTYMGHVGDYLKSLDLPPEKLQQYDLPRAIRETVANDQRVAAEALKDFTQPNPTRIADSQAMPEYKSYEPVKQGKREFSFNRDGSIRKMESVDLPPGEVQYSWREIKLQDSLTPEQAKRVRNTLPEDFPGIADQNAVRAGFGQKYVAIDAKGKAIKDNFSETLASGNTPQEAHLAGQLAQEGNALGHCVGGYVDGVLNGESRILTLRDQHGRSYATVELVPGRIMEGAKQIGTEERIVQIKGPGNGAPADYVRPYVQDLVKSGKWGDVADLEHTGLIHDKYYNDYITVAEDAKRNKSVDAAAERLATFVKTSPVFDRFREAVKRYDAYSNRSAPDRNILNALEKAKTEGLHPKVPYTYEELLHVLKRPEEFSDRHSSKWDVLKGVLREAGKLEELYGKASDQAGRAKPEHLAILAAGAGLTAYALSDQPKDPMTMAAMGLAGSVALGKTRFAGMPEPELIKAFREGTGRSKELAAAQIWDSTHRQLERSIAQMGKDVPVEDIAQRVYEKAFRTMSLPVTDPQAFRGEAKLTTYLHAIAQNEVKNAWRGEKVRPQTESMTEDAETGATSAPEKFMMEQNPEKYQSTEDVAAGNDLARRMQDALNKLPDNFRQIFEKVELEGKSYAEVAQELGVPIGTVQSGLSRAKERLQGSLRDYKDLQAGKASTDFLIGLSTIAGGAALGAALDPQNSVRNAVYGALAGGALGTSAGRGAIKAAIKSPDVTLGLISTRLGNIDPSLKLALRTHELNVLKNIDKMNDTTLPFMQATKKLKGAEEAAVSRALLNSDVETVKSVSALAATFPAVQKALSQIKTQLQALGRFGEGVTDYFPRNVKDFEGLKKTIGPEAAQGLEKALLDAEAAMNRKEHRSLTEIEQSIIANRYLYAPDQGSFMPGFAKKRTMGDVPEHLQQFYEPPVESLLRYLSGAVNDIETAKFFGRDLATNKQGKQVYTDVDGSIGNLTARLLKDGKITQAQSMEIRDILKARFEGGEKGMNPVLANIRNLTNAGLLGNIASAATQVGDSVMTIYHHGLVPTLQAVTQKIIGQERVTPKQLGLINHIAEELSDMGPTGRLVHFTMKWSGFHAIDMFAKGLGLNAALIKNEKLAMTPEGQAKFRAKYQSAFGEETGKVLDDLKNKRMSDNVETLLFSELSDAQPISKAEMPEMYLAHPNGRFLYQLKTYMLKQVDIVRRDSYQEIAKGTPEGILRGTKNLAALATVYAISNIPGDTIKDWIAGREVDPFATPKLIENIGQTFGINRYAGQQLRQGKVVETLTGMATPPLRVLQDVAKLDEKTVAYVPLAGRTVYDRYLGGNEKREIYDAISANKGLAKGEPKVKLSPAAKQYLQQKRLEKRQQEMSK